jgi:hypothetical protein
MLSKSSKKAKEANGTAKKGTTFFLIFIRIQIRIKTLAVKPLL